MPVFLHYLRSIFVLLTQSLQMSNHDTSLPQQHHTASWVNPAPLRGSCNAIEISFSRFSFRSFLIFSNAIHSKCLKVSIFWWCFMIPTFWKHFPCFLNEVNPQGYFNTIPRPLITPGVDFDVSIRSGKENFSFVTTKSFIWCLLAYIYASSVTVCMIILH